MRKESQTAFGKKNAFDKSWELKEWSWQISSVEPTRAHSEKRSQLRLSPGPERAKPLRQVRTFPSSHHSTLSHFLTSRKCRGWRKRPAGSCEKVRESPCLLLAPSLKQLLLGRGSNGTSQDQRFDNYGGLGLLP